MYKCSYPSNGDGKKTITILFMVYFPFEHLNYEITSGFTLNERWEAGTYYIIFWFVMPKAEFSSRNRSCFYTSVPFSSKIL